jgi:predicted RecB family nuclease
MSETANLIHMPHDAPTPHLSKSRFIAGLQCLRRLWHICHTPEATPRPGAALESLFAGGHEVGRLARLSFPGGVLVDENGGFAHAARMTRRLIGSGGRTTCGASPLLFEAAFAFEDVLVRADILQRRNDGRWRLIEVKATLDLKDHHIADLAVQRHVLEGWGLEVPEACLMHLDRDYVYNGHGHRLDDLFVIEDVSDRVLAFQARVPERLREQRVVLASGEPPAIEPGGQCTNPFTCEFCALCSPELPMDHPALLPRIGREAVERFRAEGIDSVAGIPLDHPLSAPQQRARRAVLEGGAVIEPEVRAELAGLGWPRWYMDFETSNPAVPRHRGMGPYNVIPFQWSLHRQAGPRAPLEHFEFLADEAEDPRRRFADTLLETLGRDSGPVVVYNAAFERSRLADLGRWLPRAAGALGRVADRVWDLLPVIRGHVYHPAFRGSFSLKKVLPALLPHLGYEGLAVADGGEAGAAWERLVSSGPGIAERQRLRAALLEYCGRDTLAMAALVERLEWEGR